MRTRLSVISVVVVLLLAAGCGPKVAVQPLAPEKRAPNTGNLDVYESADAVGRSYKKIALLSVTSQKRAREEKGSAEEPLERQAKEIGADAVIIKERRARTQRNDDGMGGSFEFTVYELTAEAIVYE
jgi:hypothetical protein